MRQQANKKRRDIQFKIGDLVLVKLQPYRQTTVATQLNSKLCRCYFGSFPIAAHAGPVTYTLELPSSSRIYPTFHVSLLKAFHREAPVTSYPLPELSHTNKPLLVPIAVLAGRIIMIQDTPIKQVLVQWSHNPPEDSNGRTSKLLVNCTMCPTLRTRSILREGKVIVRPK
ncbi:uncharacterized protein LOC112090357 [Morus notabilis]|uniref:uncharacterized protein LOC112090357 n=1 Tax=Morus notabilis TaxID=981085 RepID=UPI000CECF55C|nr:uncharacterized protein LOC112090357 [Morus notabilis]